MKHDIINYLGEKIGDVVFPPNTSQEEIAFKLSEYAKPPPKLIPDHVTPRQIRQALILSGILLTDIEAVISMLPEPQRYLAKVEWDYSLTYDRNRPLVATVAKKLGMTDDQIDKLWDLASSL